MVRKVYALGDQQGKTEQVCPQRLWVEIPVGRSLPKRETPKC